MSFLNSLFGGDTTIPTIIAALAAVLLLIVLGVWALKLVFNATGRVARGRAKRLGVVDVTPVDQKRQLVLVRRDNVEHLLLIGGLQDLVIETGIEAEPAAARPARQPAVVQPQSQSAAVAAAPPPGKTVPMAPAPSVPARRVRETNLPPDFTALRTTSSPERGSLRNTGFMRADEKREPDFIPSVPPDWSSPPNDSDTPFPVLPVPDDLFPGPGGVDKGDEPDLDRNANEPRSGGKDQNS